LVMGKTRVEGKSQRGAWQRTKKAAGRGGMKDTGLGDTRVIGGQPPAKKLRETTGPAYCLTTGGVRFLVEVASTTAIVRLSPRVKDEREGEAWR